ncbi:MAG TPA: galactitol-1-phosphate 5-dehydrogenase [Ruminococcaceae bacterium]|jgi:L-iditol 2-dehydrogenase|nr:galactitol-1-phosphate 5-dehydrogenase [Oscillospiraceae bacterium]
MKAVRLYKPGDLRVEQVGIPAVQDDEVLVKVKAVGVCGSDIPRVNRYGAHISQITIGHEFGGEIVELGSEVKNFRQEDHVTVAPLIPCYQCEWCKMGEYSLCEDYSYYGSRCDGAMAQYIAVKEKNLLKVSGSASFEDIATVDPCANAMHGLIRGNFKKGETICVCGAGPIGLYVIQCARIMGAKKIIAVDILDQKLEVAEKCGADVTVNSANADVAESVKEATDGRGADMVIDLTGVPAVQNTAVLCARKLGRVVYLGISHRPLEYSAQTVDDLLRKQITVTGSWNSFSQPFPGREWTESVRLFEEGKLTSKYMISHRLALEDAPMIFHKIATEKFFFNKIMFFPWGDGVTDTL